MRARDLPPGFRRIRAGMLVLAAGLFAAQGCTPAEDSFREPEYVMMVGIDVSGSFRASGHYEDALDFLAHYLYGHLNGLGDLRKTTSLFVGPVGGQVPGETKAFHPIHDFRGKGIEQIAADLKRWFPVREQDRLTDYDAFFRRVSELAKRRGLVLAPMNIVLLTDGVPDVAAGRGRTAAADGRAGSGTAAAGSGGSADPGAPSTQGGSADLPYPEIDLSPLEYLSRSITVRLLYPGPGVATGWERNVERRRVRLWTTNETVMAGWRDQLREGVPAEQQDALWTWIADNVDFRVRQRLF